MANLGRRMFGVTAAMTLALAAAAGVQAANEKPEYTEMTLGNPAATVVVTEYASFTCPHCKSFHENGFRRLKREYIDTGKILFRLREVYFDHYGLWAGIIARCGGEEKYFGIVDLLFAKQEDWSLQQQPTEVVNRLFSIGVAAGLTWDQVDACMTDEPTALMLFETQQEFVKSDDISATPSFVINDELYSSLPYEEFAEIIETLLAE